MQVPRHLNLIFGSTTLAVHYGLQYAFVQLLNHLPPYSHCCNTLSVQPIYLLNTLWMQQERYALMQLLKACRCGLTQTTSLLSYEGGCPTLCDVAPVVAASRAFQSTAYLQASCLQDFPCMLSALHILCPAHHMSYHGVWAGRPPMLLEQIIT